MHNFSFSPFAAYTNSISQSSARERASAPHEAVVVGALWVARMVCGWCGLVCDFSCCSCWLLLVVGCCPPHSLFLLNFCVVPMLGLGLEFFFVLCIVVWAYVLPIYNRCLTSAIPEGALPPLDPRACGGLPGVAEVLVNGGDRAEYNGRMGLRGRTKRSAMRAHGPPRCQ